MERIGITASKMAKDNLGLYNFYVLLISFMLAFIIFLVAGGAIFLGLVVIGAITQGTVPEGTKNEWMELARICMAALTGVISFVTLFAIARNVKFRKN